MRNFNQLFLATLGLGLLAGSSAYAQTGVGTGSTAPRTMLDVNGAISVTETTAAVSSNAATIPMGFSLVRLTGTATAPVTLAAAASPAPVAGQHLIIYNTTTQTATFAGQGIAAGQSLAFIYSGGGWQATAGGSTPVTANNGVTKTGNNVALGGALTQATSISNVTAVNTLSITSPTAADAAITVGNTAAGAGRVQLGNPNHGIMRDLTSSTGGAANDVAVYTSQANVHLVANPNTSGNTNLPLGQLTLTPAGRVGLGTTTPAANLDLVGASGATQLGMRNAAAYDHLYITHDGNGPVINAGGAETGLRINVGASTTGTYGDASQNYTEGLRVTPAGQVGIGGIAPAASLHVNGGMVLAETASPALTGVNPAYLIPVDVSQVRLVAGGTAPTGTVALTTTSPVVGQHLAIYNGTPIPATLGGQSIPAAQAVEFIYSNGAWRTLGDGGASALTALTANNGLTKTGANVALGGALTQATTINASSFPLAVTGLSNTSATFGTGGGIVMGSTLSSAGSTGVQRLEFTSNSDPNAAIGHTTRAEGAATEINDLYLYSGDNLDATYGPDRIRMVAPTILFQSINANGGVNTLANAETNTNTTTNMFIGSNGNVGIGTTAPAETLEVNGNIRLGSEPASFATGWGNYLEFDGSGVGSDPIGLARYAATSNESELRLVLGDDPLAPGTPGADRFVLGTTSASVVGQIATGAFTPRFSVYSNGATGIGINPAAANLLDVAGTAGTSNVRMASLGGTGTRPVQAAADGTLSTYTPSAANTPNIYTADGALTGPRTLSGITATNTLNFRSATAADAAITVGSTAAGAGRLQLGNANHGIMRDLTGSTGGGGNDVAVYTSQASLHLVANPATTGSTSLPLGQFTLASSGNVGIGTTTPGVKLDVVVNNSDGGGMDDTRISTYGTPSITNYTYASRGTVAAPANLQANDLLADNALYGRVNGGFSYLSGIKHTYLGSGTTALSDMRFTTSGGERMRVSDAGNVGIGTTAPFAPLQFSNALANRKLVLYDGTNSATVTNDHQFYGLGIQNSTLRYQVEGPNTDHVFYAGINATSSKELMRITGDGKVGIGTNNPTEALEVDGNVRLGADGGTTLGAGNVLEFVGPGLNSDNMGIYRFNTAVDASELRVAMGDNGGTVDRFVLGMASNGVVGTIATTAWTPVTSFYTDGRLGVGMGATAPSTALQVNGIVKAGTDAIGNARLTPGTASQAGYLEVYKGNGTTRLGYIGYNNTQLTYVAENGAQHVFTGGNVGIGTATPTSPLAVIGSATPNTGGITVSTGTVTSGNIFQGTANVSATEMTTEYFSSQRASTNYHASHPTGTATGTLFVGFNYAGAYIGGISQNGTTGVLYNTTSDIRLKENIRPTAYGLSDVMKVQVRDYNYKTDKSTPQTGFIAQQLYTVFPMAVTKGGEDAKTNPWTVDYSKLTPLLTKAIQEEQAEIEALKAANAKLVAENAALKTGLDGKASASTLDEMKTALQALRAEVQTLKASGTTASTK
jgi:hypothetical protein